MEYTLEDAFETLKDTEMERDEIIETLSAKTLNNGPVALNASCNPEDVKNKQHKLCRSLMRQIFRGSPKDYPIPDTSDLHVEVLRQLEEEVENAEQLFDKMEMDLSKINEDISYLKSKKQGFEKMKKSHISATELMTETNYNKELAITKRIFRDTRNDLVSVVRKLFPDNTAFETFLQKLTAAYAKGGDDSYVDVTPAHLEFVHFLIAANIAMFHRNDKNKVRLMDMV